MRLMCRYGAKGGGGNCQHRRLMCVAHRSWSATGSHPSIYRPSSTPGTSRSPSQVCRPQLLLPPHTEWTRSTATRTLPGRPWAPPSNCHPNNSPLSTLHPLSRPHRSQDTTPKAPPPLLFPSHAKVSYRSCYPYNHPPNSSTHHTSHVQRRCMCLGFPTTSVAPAWSVLSSVTLLACLFRLSCCVIFLITAHRLCHGSMLCRHASTHFVAVLR